MAKSQTSQPIRLENVRLSFPVLFTPKPFSAGATPQFSAAFLFDPSKADHATALTQIKTEIKKLATAAYGTPLPKDLKFCLKNGNDKSYDGYAGMMVLAAANKIRPTVVNRRKELVAEGEAEAPYAGCYVNATVSLWSQNNQYGKRINANLRAVQFVKDGEAFGRGPVDADEEFEALEDGGASAAADEGDDLGI